MRPKTKTRLGLIGFALISIANLGLLAGPAHAADYSGTCANVPTGAQTGNAIIGSAGAACSLPSNINFSGNVTILGSTITSSGPITAGQALSLTGSSTIGVAALNGASVKAQTTGSITFTTANATAGYVDVVANGGSGDINATSLTAANGYIKAVAGRKVNISGALTTSGSGGARNILVTAQTTIKTGNLTAASNANIVVKSQKGGGTTALTVGTSGTNGIGTVTAGANGVIYIVNGVSGANANISLTAMNKIVTTAGGNYVILDARGGTLTMPSGTLSTPHSTGQASIQLMAKTVTFTGAATLQANNSGTVGTLHGVTISANTINHNGLTINADGPGANPAEAYVYFQAMGTTVITDSNEDVTNLYVGVNNTNPNAVTGPVSITSTGGLLKATANGNNTRIKVDAYPIAITGGPVTFQTNGTYGREIQISNQNQTNGTQGVTFSGGDVLLDASASANGYGGTVKFLNIDKLAVSSPNFTIKSDGATSGNGDAGFISIYTYSYSQTSSSKAKISANGPAAGSGNGGYIYFYPNLLSSTLKLGTNNGDLQITADAGANGGDGGSITINPNSPNGNINFDTVNAVSAKSSSGATANSKGGSVTIIANPEISINPSTPAIDINVDGKGTRDGGTITILANGTLKIGSQAGALNLSAKAAGTGNGGGVEIGYISDLTQSDLLSVAAGKATNGNGKGGTINFYNLGKTKISGQMHANGAGSGIGGNITVSGTSYDPMNLDSVELSASSDELDGTGKGGNITIANAGTISMQNAKFSANGGGTNGDGGIINVNINPISAAIDITTSKFEARGDVNTNQNGKGGRVSINNAKGTLTPTDSTIGINVPFTIKVNGGLGISTSDFAGSIALNGVTCQQWKTIAATFPKLAWDCISPATGSNISTLLTAGSSLSSTQSQLANLISPPPAAPNVGVYAFNSLVEHQKFFGRPLDPPYQNQYGISLVSWVRISSTFASSSNGNNITLSGSSTIMVGALVHELGHNLDYIWGPGLTNYSSQASWTNLINPDLLALNNLPCNQVFFQTTCNDNPTKNNKEIFEIRFSSMFDNSPSKGPLNGEFFAAMFEHVESSITGSSYQVEPELEMALDKLNNLKQTMQQLVANPPQATK